jgi:hypothetical protein
MPMSPAFPTLVLLAGLGCASSGGPPPGTTESLDIRSPRSTLTIDTRRETFISSDTVRAAPLDVYRAITEIFGTLDFKVQKADSAALFVTTQPTLLRHDLKGIRLSKYLSCGQSALGSNADLYFLSVRLHSTVQPAGAAAAILRTNVSATARPPDNGATSVRCESNGLLEHRIRDLVRVNALSSR